MRAIIILSMALFSLTTQGEEKLALESQVSGPNIEVVEKLIAQNFVVGFSWVSLPLNSILLIKTSGESCAIKFINFSRGNNKSTSSIFRSGDESFDATMEVLELSSGKIRIIELTKRPFYGLGKIGFSPSNNRIYCGNSEYIWQYPTSVVILPKDTKSKFSPTYIENFDKVDFSSLPMHWYGYEEGRKIKVLPKDSITKR